MLRPGERIGDWIVETRLGERDRGAVFLARHSMNLNLRGALKVAQPVDYEEARASLVAEVEPLLTLQHEALTRLLGWGEDYERRMLWMTTELLRGQSLEERLSEERPFDPEEIGFVFGRLGGVLALIHSHGSHHGDLRPSDVLIAEGRQIRLTGFGTVFRDGKQGRVDPETLAYVGPEYFDDPDSCSPVAADIYALGLILYEAITGRRVFPLEPGLKPAPQVARLMGLKLRMGPLDPGDEVPLPLRRIVLETTDPDPAARPGDLSSFLAALGMASRLRAEEAPVKPPAPEPAGDVVDFVRLASSVLGREQLQTPFPFAPPGWGPRGHQPPPPLANLRTTVVFEEVPEAGRVLEVHKLDQRRPDEDPLGIEPVATGDPLGESYDEPEVLPAEEDEPRILASAEEEIEEAPAVEAPAVEAVPVASAPAETSEPEPHEAPAATEEDAEDQAISTGLAGVFLPDWQEQQEPAAPEPTVAEQVDFEAEGRRSARAFVPPPPVPDPSDVGLAGRPTIIPEAASEAEPSPAAAVDLPDPPVERYDQSSPVASEPTSLSEELPEPVAPSASPSEDDEVSWFDRYDDLPESPVAPAPPVADPEIGVAYGEEAAGEARAEPAPPQGSEEPPEAPVAEPSAPTWPGESEEELPEEDDWSWHDEGSYQSDSESPRPEHRGVRDDPYTRPVDDDFGDVFDPSASEIAADVFGDHPERAAWVKRGLVALFVILVIAGLAYVLHDWSDETAGTAASRVEVPPAPVVRPGTREPPSPGVSAPPPVSAEDAEPAAPALDLQAVVASPEHSPRRQPDLPPSAPAPRSTTPSPRSAPAPVSAAVAPPVQPVATQPSGLWVTTPTVEVGASRPSVEPVLPAPAPAAPPTSGLMGHLREGWSALDSSNLLGAQTAFMAALQDEAGNGMAHYGLGQVGERARDYTSAEYHYGRAFQVLGSNPSMRGELEAALRRVGAKASAPAAPAPGTAAAPAAQTPPASTNPEVQVTRKKRDELEESFRDELWDEDPDE